MNIANTEPLGKLIKKPERETPEVQAETGFFVDPNRWSIAVSSWVREFQQDGRSQSPPAFDRLFKEAFRSQSHTR